MASLVFFMEYMYGDAYTSEGFDQNLDSTYDLSTVYDIHRDNPLYQGSDVSSSPMGVRDLPTDFSWTVISSFSVNGNWLGYMASDSAPSSSDVIGLDNPVSVSDIISALPPK